MYERELLKYRTQSFDMRSLNKIWNKMQMTPKKISSGSRKLPLKCAINTRLECTRPTSSLLSDTAKININVYTCTHVPMQFYVSKIEDDVVKETKRKGGQGGQFVSQSTRDKLRANLRNLSRVPVVPNALQTPARVHIQLARRRRGPTRR